MQYQESFLGVGGGDVDRLQGVQVLNPCFALQHLYGVLLSKTVAPWDYIEG